MGLHTPSTAVNWTQNVIATTTAETILFTSNPVNPPFDNSQLIITWNLIIVMSAGTTSVIIRLRRGLLITSPLVNQGAAQTQAASATQALAGSYSDLPGITAGVQYVLTMQNAGSSGNSTMTDGSLAVLSL